MTGGYVYKHEGTTYLCSNEPIIMHRKGKHMLGDHYLTAIVTNGDDLEDGEQFGPKELIVDWDMDVAKLQIIAGDLPTVKAFLVK